MNTNNRRNNNNNNNNKSSRVVPLVPVHKCVYCKAEGHLVSVYDIRAGRDITTCPVLMVRNSTCTHCNKKGHSVDTCRKLQEQRQKQREEKEQADADIKLRVEIFVAKAQFPELKAQFLELKAQFPELKKQFPEHKAQAPKVSQLPNHAKWAAATAAKVQTLPVMDGWHAPLVLAPLVLVVEDSSSSSLTTNQQP